MNYQAEEVRETATVIRDHAANEWAEEIKAASMLTAYADLLERIKADEGAVSVAQPAGRGRDEDRMSDELRDFIQGMSVSVDVSTGDADAGNRYFGTVTEVMDDRGSKHGVILLVQDAEPNFALPSDARKRREAETFQVPNDTLDRLIVGRATEGDQMLAYNAITAALAAQGQSPASPAGVPEEWINPDSIPQPIIQAFRDADLREFGNDGTDGYYKRILAAIFKAIAAAPSAHEGESA